MLPVLRLEIPFTLYDANDIDDDDDIERNNYDDRKGQEPNAFTIVHPTAARKLTIIEMGTLQYKQFSTCMANLT